MAYLEAIDHLGNTFPSEKDMYEFYGLTKHQGETRKRNGWSVERVLTTPVKSVNKNIMDHVGNSYKNKTEMCKYYNITIDIFNNRKSKGWNLEQILTTPIHNIAIGNICYDHKGNKFNSENKMYDFYNIPRSLGKQRKRNGWSVERILTTPVDLYTSDKLLDPVTNEYMSQAQLIKKYNIKRSQFYSRYLKFGKSLAVSLNISIFIKSNTFKVNKTIYNLRIDKRTKKGKDVFECYIMNEDGTETFRIMSQEMIDQYCIEQYKKEKD